jgi:hypothetical protein
VKAKAKAGVKAKAKAKTHMSGGGCITTRFPLATATEIFLVLGVLRFRHPFVL